MDTGAATEQVRVLNFLQMFESGVMGDTSQGTTMRALPLMCKAVVDIRKLNRKFICQLRERNWRPFADDSYPDEGEEIIVRLHDGHTLVARFLEEDIHEMEHEGVEYWLRIPKLNEEEKL